MFIHKTAKSQYASEFARDVSEGLRRSKKKIKPMYFYDELGSLLFEKICLQEEYYLTRTERNILENCSNKIVKMQNNNHISILELGSGSSVKTRILLEHFLSKQKPIYYFPIDVSDSMLYRTIHRLSVDLPHLYIKGIASDYIEGIVKVRDFISSNNEFPKKKILLFLGSSIGNFEPDDAIDFLKTIKNNMDKRDILLIGFDLQKNPKTLEAAYNDKAGVTAKFNLNLLNRINKELGGEFDIRDFEHLAFYNENQGRIEMHLVSKIDQQVNIRGIHQTISFKHNETIQTEHSYKYTLTQISLLARKSGFEVKENFTDKKKWYDLALFSPI
ncbi:MAG TPA: L-histidine N(alpha)-methyltransferase [Nitrososphaeraceae archaeon]|nr:L-histidine N(alpha)-methyltransferase [Nitrososphaeraceae archaeon]